MAWEAGYRLDEGRDPMADHAAGLPRRRRDWNIRLNGRNVGIWRRRLAAPVDAGDEISIFPPGR